jgi:RNA polymerase sigma-70 factor (ECF subfamily)
MSLRALTAKQLAAERHLIEASQRDPSRFAALYERYFGRVYAFALTRTGDHTAAEDVTAETFRRALQNLSRFEWREVPFSAWLFRIASNAAVDLQRLEARNTSLDSLPEEGSDSWEARFIEAEERVQLFELVKRLKKEQRQVVLMRFAERRSSREIAQIMGRSESAIKALQFRALERLRTWAVGSQA